MRKRHEKNERIKRRYFGWLEDTQGMAPTTVDQVAAAIAQFEASTGHKDFAVFHIEQARRFKRVLDEATNPATGKPLAKATIYSRLMALKAFVKWLADQPGYKRRIKHSDAAYFNPTNNDGRIAKAIREKPVATEAQIRSVLDAMPSGTDIEKRDRALVAAVFLTGARDDAIASMSLKHVDVAKRTVFQDARQVRTKNRKTFTSSFFPVGDDIEAIFTGWLDFLKRDRQFGPDDPVFPATQIGLDASGLFAPVGLSRKHWTDASAIRRIFRAAFERAGLPYFNPHSLRNTLATIGEQRARNAEELKAWSQNLGHSKVLTTLTSYGSVASHRQFALLDAMRDRSPDSPTGVPSPETVQWVLSHLSKQASG